MKVQNWLLPSKTNKYHPHLLRPLGLGIAAAVLLSINLTQNLTAAHKFQVLGIATNISASEVISLSNQQRANNGVAGLAYNSQLTSAAEAKARDMFAKDYWAHYAPDGTSPWSFITAAGYSYTTAGENLAKDFDTSNGVVQGWMNSPEHRANILNSSFKDTGVAVMNGTLQGEQTTLVVAFYGAQRAAAPAPAAVAPTPKTPTRSVAQPTPTPVAATTQTPTPVPEASTQATEPSTQPKTTPKVASKTAPSSAVAAERTIDDHAVAVRQSRTWAQNATLLIISTLFLVSVLKHTIVWRTKKRGLRHIWLRAHPAAQYGLLLVAIAANLTSGIGVIR